MAERKLPTLWLETESLDSATDNGRGYVWAVVADNTPQHMVALYAPAMKTCKTCPRFSVLDHSARCQHEPNRFVPVDGSGYCHEHPEASAMPNQLDHEYTDEIVCPYCGHKHHDSWEYGEPGDEMYGEEHECGSCQRKFIWSRRIKAIYSTETWEAHVRELAERAEWMAQYRREREAKR